MDINERTVIAESEDGVAVGYNLAHVADIRKRYSILRASIARNTRSNTAARNRLLSKYGKRERDRSSQALHVVSKHTVNGAQSKKQAIVLEKLKGIRERHKRGAPESKGVRARLNRWSFGLFQRQMTYKAAWQGVKVAYVSPHNTSRTCFHCSFVNNGLKCEREWTCPNCGTALDRDLNAARNVLARFQIKEAASVWRSNESPPYEGGLFLRTSPRSREVKHVICET